MILCGPFPRGAATRLTAGKAMQMLTGTAGSVAASMTMERGEGGVSWCCPLSGWLCKGPAYTPGHRARHQAVGARVSAIDKSLCPFFHLSNCPSPQLSLYHLLHSTLQPLCASGMGGFIAARPLPYGGPRELSISPAHSNACNSQDWARAKLSLPVADWPKDVGHCCCLPRVHSIRRPASAGTGTPPNTNPSVVL